MPTSPFKLGAIQRILSLVLILVLYSLSVQALALPHVLLSRSEKIVKQAAWRNKFAVACGVIGGILNAGYVGWYLWHRYLLRKERKKEGEQDGYDKS